MSKRKIGEVYDDDRKKNGGGGGDTGDAKKAPAAVIAAGALPAELDDLVPEMLDMRSLSSLACAGVRWRDASVREMLAALHLWLPTVRRASGRRRHLLAGHSPMQHLDPSDSPELQVDV